MFTSSQQDKTVATLVAIVKNPHRIGEVQFLGKLVDIVELFQGETLEKRKMYRMKKR